MSKKIKENFENGLYELVIEETINSKNPEDILYRIMSFECMHDYKNSYNCYIENRVLVENWDIISSAKTLFYLLVEQNKDDLIPKEIEHFKDFSYVNQETEEFINNLENYINEIQENFKISKNHNNIDLDDIISKLNDGNRDEKLFAIQEIFNLEGKGISCDGIVADFLKKTSRFDTNYGLLLYYAITRKLNENVVFKKADKYYSMTPALFTDYVVETIAILNEKLKVMSSSEKNLSIIRYIILIAKPTFIYLLPYKINKKDIDTLMGALVATASDIFDVDYSQDPYYKTLTINQEIIEWFIEVIKEVQKDF